MFTFGDGGRGAGGAEGESLTEGAHPRTVAGVHPKGVATGLLELVQAVLVAGTSVDAVPSDGYQTFVIINVRDGVRDILNKKSRANKMLIN